MGKIDVDRLIIYLWGNTLHFDCIECALENQGLKIVNGEIVEIGAAEKSGNELNLASIIVDEIKYLPWQRVKEGMLGELKWNEDEKIRKDIIHHIEFEREHSLIPQQRAESWIAWFEKRGEQKPAWSDYDTKMLVRAMRAVNYFLTSDDHDEANQCFSWLKNLKDRVALKPQHKWKPSEEHIHSLEYIINSLDSMFHAIGHIDNTTKPRLEEILENLKKLAEE